MVSEKKMQNITEMLEKIVFDENNLGKLKIALNQLKSGELSIKELRETIIELRAEMFEALLKFIPFQLKLRSAKKDLSQYTEVHPDSSQLEQEIQEKNSLLETIGSRLNRILENLDNT